MRSSRRGRTKAVAPAPAHDYRNITNTMPRREVFSADEVAHIHATALRILQELGIKVLLPEGREVFARAGARVEDDMVFLDAAMVEEHVAKAPAHFTMEGREPNRNLHVGGNTIQFGAGAGCPNISDHKRGRRPGTLADFIETVKLQHSFDIMCKLVPCIEPQDIPVHLRHLDVMEQQLTLSDKSIFMYARGREQTEDSFECIRLAKGLTEDEFANAAHCFTVINTNSPRQLDRPMTQGIIDFARFGQPSVITPFCLAGAMAPITTAGALTLSHAEALAGITLSQIVRPGTPVVYGAFSSNVDMKSGAPVFGTPEHLKANFGAGQLARHVNLPWRSAAGTAANLADSQAAGETMNALWGTILSGANFVYHAAGWLEGGLVFGYEKFIADTEMLQMIARAMGPVDASDDVIGFDNIASVEPGGHFFAAPQTMERYASEFYQPIVHDWSNFGQWTEAGAKPNADRARDVAMQAIKDFEAPPMDHARREALADFCARRRSEGGAPLMD
ncbi:MAG: trimethylamine methyltransferase family protein [Pseudomonadota bacterium]